MDSNEQEVVTSNMGYKEVNAGSYSGSGVMSESIAPKVTGLMTFGSVIVILISTCIFYFYRLDDATLEDAYQKTVQDIADT